MNMKINPSKEELERLNSELTLEDAMKLSENGITFVISNGKITQIAEFDPDALSKMLPENKFINIFTDAFKQVYQSLKDAENVAVQLAEYFYNEVLNYDDLTTLENTSAKLHEFSLNEDVIDDILESLKEELQKESNRDQRANDDGEEDYLAEDSYDDIDPYGTNAFGADNRRY